jgi:hypothetical protein
MQKQFESSSIPVLAISEPHQADLVTKKTFIPESICKTDAEKRAISTKYSNPGPKK